VFIGKAIPLGLEVFIYGCSVDGRGHYRREDSRVQVPTKE
jgi:hypothetical protein